MTAPTPEVAQRIARYEEWVRRLQGTLADYERREPLYRRFFYGLTGAGFACFAFGAWAGLWGSVCSTFVSVAGYAMYKTRVWELKTEIDEALGDIECLRTGRDRRARPRW